MPRIQISQEAAKALKIAAAMQDMRLQPMSLHHLVHNAALRVGLYDESSDRLEDHFSPHCCRHWNATHLLRAGMSRDYVKWLRGDAMKEAIDIYYHLDPEDVRRAYLAHIPRLGI